ncbi:hypothetical protein PC119_g19601 [Phytophthora cactorum]|nr:hypothetical protein PC120_g26070 [Phytophthora cactorum]KAG2987825.1 hypothetical protein PC119_g19601 [Phytophthora cactorum]
MERYPHSVINTLEDIAESSIRYYLENEGCADDEVKRAMEWARRYFAFEASTVRAKTRMLPEESLFELYAASDDLEDGGHIVYTIGAGGLPHRTRKIGLQEVESCEEDGTRVVPDGKRVICSVGGIMAISGRYVDCCPTEILVDTDAVASLTNKSVLRRIGRSKTPLRTYTRSLNIALTHEIKALGIIELPVRLGSVEKEVPFIVRNTLQWTQY